MKRTRIRRAVNHRRAATLATLASAIRDYRTAFPRGPRDPRASVVRLGFFMHAAGEKGATT